MSTEKTQEQLQQEAQAAEEAAKAAIQDPPAEETPVGEETPAAEEGTTDEDTDFLNMSDDEFEKLEEPVVADPEEDSNSEDTPAEKEPAAEEPKSEEPPKAEPAPAKEPAAEEPKKEEEPKPAETVKADAEPKKEVTTPAADKAETATVTDADRVKGFDTLMAPFKANGREMKVQNVEEARRLMQMGAGHVKYQQQVRPQIALAQTLKNSGIDSDRLNFLIELHNGNKDAVQKLVRDSGLDPYEIKTDDEAKTADKDYRPKDYSVSDSAVTLEQTVSSVRSTEGGSELLTDIRNNWDDGSRQSLLEDPGILSVLNEQKHSGIYDQITAEIDRKRTLGGLNGVSFLKAYHQVGTEMEKRGAFKREPEPSPDDSTTETALKETPKESTILATETAKPKPEAGGDPTKVAAPKPGQPAKAAPDNFMDMSDEEFSKFEAQFA